MPFAKIVEFDAGFLLLNQYWSFNITDHRQILNNWSLLLFQEGFIGDRSGCFGLDACGVRYVKVI